MWNARYKARLTVGDVVIGIVMVLLALGLIGILVLVVYDAHERTTRCEAAGGQVEDYNCSTIIMPMACGKGCTMFVPIKSCDHKCVGAHPEAP